ncbi:MAG: hypothetical protein U0Q12_01370 [Vicinamibacterales bacterium]
MYAHLRIDEFFVQVERARRPELAGVPVVVGGTAESPGTVVAVSAEAKVLGIVPGVSLRAAAARCPRAAFVDGAVDHYLAASAAADEVLRRFVPCPTWHALDEASLEIDESRVGVLPRDLVDGVRAALERDLGLRAALGTARSRMAARVAAQLASPSGVLMVMPGHEAAFLAPIDVSHLLDVGAPARQKLRAAGFDRIGDVARASTATLALVLGRQAHDVWSAANGHDIGPTAGVTRPRSMTRTCQLVRPTRAPAQIEPFVRFVVTRMIELAKAQSLFVESVTVKADGPQGRGSRSTTLREPTLDEWELIPVCLALLQHAWRSAGRVVSSIIVSWDRLVEHEGQLPLFRSGTAGSVVGALPRGHAHVRALLAGRQLAGRRMRRRRDAAQ